MARVEVTSMNGASEVAPAAAARSVYLANLVAAGMAPYDRYAQWLVVPVDPRPNGPTVHVLVPGGPDADGEQLAGILRSGQAEWSAAIFDGVFPEDGAAFLTYGGPCPDQAAFEATAPGAAAWFVEALGRHQGVSVSPISVGDQEAMNQMLAVRVVDDPYAPPFED